MSTTLMRFKNIEPKLVRRENGGWLAISPVGASLRVGVEAWSAEDARVRFVRELGEWSALLDGHFEDSQSR